MTIKEEAQQLLDEKRRKIAVQELANRIQRLENCKLDVIDAQMEVDNFDEKTWRGGAY